MFLKKRWFCFVIMILLIVKRMCIFSFFFCSQIKAKSSPYQWMRNKSIPCLLKATIFELEYQNQQCQRLYQEKERLFGVGQIKKYNRSSVFFFFFFFLSKSTCRFKVYSKSRLDLNVQGLVPIVSHFISLLYFSVFIQYKGGN